MTRLTRSSRWARWPEAREVGEALQPHMRCGMTLIELLVVISIMMLLAVVTIPALRPAMENRRIREAPRSVSVFLSAAQNRATEGNRSFGIELERDPNLVLGCRTLYQVEVPTPYAGELTTLVIDFENPAVVGNTATALVRYRTEDAPGLGFVRPGDELIVGVQPDRWPITNIVPISSPSIPNTWEYTFTFYVAPGKTFPSATLSLVAYQIIRQPVRTRFPPLQLPRSVVVDLTYSGAQNLFLPYNNADQRSVVILFNSRRAVDRIYATDVSTNYYMAWRAISPVFLLVGRRDRVPVMEPNPPASQPPAFVLGASPAEDTRSNLLDMTNLWVGVNAQTGLAVCAEMAETDPAAPVLTEARAFVREFRSMGGR